MITEVTGIIKKRKGVLTLTAKGSKIIADDAKLLESIFKGFTQKFNWHYFDNYSDEMKTGTIGQVGMGFSLILLSKYGQIFRLDDFYAEKYFNAFPNLLESVKPTYGTVRIYCFNCYSTRTFDRFLIHFGLVEIKKGKQFSHEDVYVKKTALFDKLISILPHRELSQPPNY